MIASAYYPTERIAAERDSLRKSLQLLIRQRQYFTEKEMARMASVGVSFDSGSKELQWTPVDGNGVLSSEWEAYQKSLLTLLEEEAHVPLTAKDVEEALANGVSSAQFLAEIEEMSRNAEHRGNGR
jgi:hypothetical protein